MAYLEDWNKIKTTSSIFSKDHIHDFALGPFSLSDNLDLESGVQEVKCPLTHNPASTNWNYNSSKDANWQQTSLVPYPPTPGQYLTVNHNETHISQLFVPNYWATLLLHNLVPVANFTNKFKPGDKLTRIKAANVIAPSYNEIIGPYTLNILGPGIQIIDFYLFYVGNFTLAAPSGSSIYNLVQQIKNQDWNTSSSANQQVIEVAGFPYKAAAKKRFVFNIFIKAVSVIKLNGSTGQILPYGHQLPAESIVPPVYPITILDKSANRGDSVVSEWKIERKLAGSSIYIPATPGSHYNLLGGSTLLTDLIQIEWINDGSYLITNTATGASSESSGPNTSFTNVKINIGLILPLEDIITWPEVKANVEVLPGQASLDEDNNPETIEGYEEFKVRVTPNVDALTGSWIIHDPLNPGSDINLNLSVDQWKQKIEEYGEIKCVLYKEGVEIDVREGWGPHDFVLSKGNHEIKYLIYTR